MLQNYDSVWTEYIRNSSRVQDPEHARFLMWVAAGLGKWSDLAVLETRWGVFPSSEVGEIGLLYSALNEFGEVPEMLQWLSDRGAAIDLDRTN